MYLLSACLSPSQLVELRANEAMWCERRWDCRGIQASHKLWVHSCSMDTAREHLRVRDRSQCGPDFTGLQIPGNYLHTGNFWESWPRCMRRKYPQAAQSKTKLLGLELGKAMAEAGSALAIDLVFICDICFYLSPSKPPWCKFSFKTAEETDLFPSLNTVYISDTGTTF